MKALRYLLLASGLVASLSAAYAQSDEYLDDAYMSRKDIEARQAKAKAEAEKKRAAEAEALRIWQENYAKERAEAIKAQRSREIDAYNGVLSETDSMAIALQARRRALQDTEAEINPRAYGEYSRRLGRFYGNGNVIVNNYYYDDFDAYYRGGVGISVGMGYYPWYGGYYSTYRNSPWSSWDYDWYGRRYYGYYDPFYDPWRYSSWGGYYGGYYGGYWGVGFGYSRYSMYPYYYGYYPYSYYGGVYYTPRSNQYRGAARSGYNHTSSYDAYQRAQGYQHNVGSYGGNSYNQGYSRSGSSYRGTGRSIYNSNDSYSGGARSYSPSSSYSGGSSSSSSSSSAQHGSYRSSGGSHRRQ